MAMAVVPPAASVSEIPEAQKTTQKLPAPPSVAAHSDTVTISAASIKAAKDADSDGANH